MIVFRSALFLPRSIIDAVNGCRIVEAIATTAVTIPIIVLLRPLPLRYALT